MTRTRFVDKKATREVEMANGDHITLRQSLTGAERAELGGRLLDTEFDPATGVSRVRGLHLHRARIEVAHAYLVGWDFCDDEGQAVPVSRDAIESLDEDTIQEVCAHVDRLHRERNGTAA